MLATEILLTDIGSFVLRSTQRGHGSRTDTSPLLMAAGGLVLRAPGLRRVHRPAGIRRCSTGNSQTAVL